MNVFENLKPEAVILLETILIFVKYNILFTRANIVYGTYTNAMLHTEV